MKDIRLRELVEMARAVTSPLESTAVLQRAVASVASLRPVIRCLVHLREPDTGAYRLAGAAGVALDGAPELVPAGAGLTHAVAARGAPLLVPDVRQHPLTLDKDWHARENLTVYYGVPIEAGTRVLGVLGVTFPPDAPPASDELDLVELVAGLAAVAVHTADVLRESERRRRAAVELAALGRALVESLDLAEVGRRIADSVCRLLEAPASALYRLEADTNQCVLVAVSGGAGPTWTTVIPAGMGMVGVAVAERSTIAAPDVLADPRVRYPDAMRARVADNPFRPVLAVPLLVTQRVIGALAVGDRRGRTFDAHELELAQAFANHAAVALENARLYRDARARRVEAEMARAEAEAASRAKDQFLAVLSHELRNPLAPIQTATAIIRRTAGANPRVERAREVIERQLRHIARLVDDLLDVAGITQGKLALRRAPVPLRAVVAEAVETARRLFETHRQRLTVRVTSADPVVDGDRDRLRQIVTNLLLNAGKYTPPGGDIVLTLGVEGTEATIVVADNGDGIPPELIDRIFDPFVQGMQSLDRPHGGLGLGLTLVKRLVDLHGGTVTAASDGPGQGSRFEVRLPLASADPEPEPAGAPPRTRPRRFLVIEDNDDAREMLALALRLEGHEVETASDGGDGVRQAMVRRPDVVLVDIGLPGMDGFEVARRLRATLGSAVRLVALTGYGQPDDQEVGRAAGFDVHLVKPVPVDEVLAVATESGSVSGQD